MKVHNPAHPLRPRRKEGSPKMQRPGFLTKTRAGDETDTGLIEES